MDVLITGDLLQEELLFVNKDAKSTVLVTDSGTTIVVLEDMLKYVSGASLDKLPGDIGSTLIIF